jgi:metal-responsive CopG/Arc/MetJ family transcriptional regulator
MQRTKRITITLPRDMVSYLKKRSENEDRSVSALVRRALENDIREHARRLADPSYSNAAEGG